MQSTILYIKKNLNDLYPKDEVSSLAGIVMQSVTGFSVPAILIDKSKKISPIQAKKVEEIVERLKKSEPIQYILGETEFFGLPFYVDKNVLIPRPETEELVELILNENQGQSIDVLDIGTGSGAIAVSLKKNSPSFNLLAWDISSEALTVAAKNADRNGTDVRFDRVDVLNNYPHAQSFDIIVSNPPYILESEKENMEYNVLNYEPHLALFVPDNKALLFYERIADISTQILKPNGKLYFEINASQGQNVIDMLKAKGFADSMLIRDLSGNERMVVCQLD
ncbi:peptide chain release factor N(5)-glutamine methyltransferase [Viscerimonas tarda]